MKDFHSANDYRVLIDYEKLIHVQRVQLVQHEEIKKDILTLLDPVRLCTLWPGLRKLENSQYFS